MPHRSSISMESTRTTPSEAAPEMGLMTAGKPTTSAAAETSAADLIRWLAGVGRPARFMQALVFCRWLTQSVLRYRSAHAVRAQHKQPYTQPYALKRSNS